MDFPILACVAGRIFCISASSAQSVGRHARSQLSASKVESTELVRWGVHAGLVH